MHKIRYASAHQKWTIQKGWRKQTLLYTGNYKILQKEILKDINKWKGISFSITGRLNILKVTIPTHSDREVQCSAYQIPKMAFRKIEKLIVK